MAGERPVVPTSMDKKRVEEESEKASKREIRRRDICMPILRPPLQPNKVGRQAHTKPTRIGGCQIPRYIRTYRRLFKVVNRNTILRYGKGGGRGHEERREKIVRKKKKKNSSPPTGKVLTPVPAS